GFSQALRESHLDQLNEQGRLYVERIETSSRRMCDLVEDLLNLARLTRLEMRVSEIDLSGMVRLLAAELKARDPHRVVEFRVADGVTALADPELMHAAMANLLENAWKYTRKHASAVIEFGVKEEAGGSVYFVRDDGAGFDMERVDKLFNPFQRLHESKEFEG